MLSGVEVKSEQMSLLRKMESDSGLEIVPPLRCQNRTVALSGLWLLSAMAVPAGPLM